MASKVNGTAMHSPRLHAGVEVRMPRQMHQSLPMGRGVISDIREDGKVDVNVYASETLPAQVVRVPHRSASTESSGWWEYTGAS